MIGMAAPFYGAGEAHLSRLCCAVSIVLHNNVTIKNTRFQSRLHWSPFQPVKTMAYEFG